VFPNQRLERRYKKNASAERESAKKTRRRGKIEESAAAGVDDEKHSGRKMPEGPAAKVSMP